MPVARLDGRRVVSVTGEESRAFLERLITCDIDRVTGEQARFGALLTPQGKILADFIVSATEGGFRLDTAADVVPDLVKRLTLYRLRAKVSVASAPDLVVMAGWDSAPPPPDAVTDPRLPALGWRAVRHEGELPRPTATEADYAARRTVLGVPEGGRDFAWGDAFPHEALMDQLGGVDFDKGCYVGQEVVSRMQHRGTARTRIVPVIGTMLAPGAEVTAGERAVGRVAGVAGDRGFAALRLDRVAEAWNAGETLLAGEHPISLAKPDFVRFAWPGEAAGPAPP